MWQMPPQWQPGIPRWKQLIAWNTRSRVLIYWYRPDDADNNTVADKASELYNFRPTGKPHRGGRRRFLVLTHGDNDRQVGIAAIMSYWLGGNENDVVLFGDQVDKYQLTFPFRGLAGPDYLGSLVQVGAPYAIIIVGDSQHISLLFDDVKSGGYGAMIAWYHRGCLLDYSLDLSQTKPLPDHLVMAARPAQRDGFRPFSGFPPPPPRGRPAG